MFTLSFSKYQGAGNDFIMLNGDKLKNLKLNAKQIAFLCDRHKGIGADGLIIVRSLNGYDFEMIYYNADGHKSSFCGNGSRCSVRFALDEGIADGQSVSFLAADGAHHARVEKDRIVVSMKDVREVKKIGASYFLDTGSPHYVKTTRSLESIDVVKQGRAIRYDKKFSSIGGVNVNFVSILAPTKANISTYERGVENETLACGTGMTAAALVCGLGKKGKQKIEINAKGGKLVVSFFAHGDGSFSDITQAGGAVKIYRGEIAI